MTDRDELLVSISNTIEDYRQGELSKPTPKHVDRWVRQFPEGNQILLLKELSNVFKQTYFNKEKVLHFLKELINEKNLVGTDSIKYWGKANFLNIQKNGNSQAEILRLFGEALEDEVGLKLQECGEADGPFIYLDDGLFSGLRVGNDLEDWLKNEAPLKTTVNIIEIAVHTLGAYQVRKRVEGTAKALNKNIDFHIWREIEFENRRYHRDISDVLWPSVIPDDAVLREYIEQEGKYPFEPRTPGGKIENNIFSSEEGRQLLERDFLLAGMKIRSFCDNPSQLMRPLGFSAFGLGFGSMIVTFRNCPNNCPLALWWGDPEAGDSSPLSKWYPLLPRKTYGQEVNFDISF